MRNRRTKVIATLLFPLSILLLLLSLSLSIEAQQSTTFTLTNINTTGGTSSAGGSGAYNVNGAGSGIGGEHDSFSFLKLQTSGNVEMITKIIGQQNTNNYAIGGIMIRESLEDNSAHATVGISPANGINFYTRSKQPPAERPTKITLGPTPISPISAAAPVWLKIVKSGNSIAGFTSSTGYSNWTLVGETNLELSPSFYIGFAVSSNAHPSLSSVQFTNTVNMRDVPQRNPDMLLWLRADAGISETSGTIATWQDQSGFGNNATQSTTTFQPQIAPNALNGLPTLDFSKQTTNRWLQVPPGFSDFNDGVSVFVVAQAPSVVSNSRIIDFGNNTNSNNLQLYQPTNNTKWSFRAYNGNNGKLMESPNVAGTGYKLISIVHDGNFKATMWVNGSEVVSATGPSNMNNFVNIQRTGNFLGKAFGAADYWEGKIAEVIVIKRRLSTLERKSLESYFYYKYGNTITTTPKPVPPVMSIQSGVYTSSQLLTITPPPLVNEVRYTTNGSDPTTSSTLYTGPINVNSSTLVKAISVFGGQTSDIAMSAIDIDSNSVDVSRLGLITWLKANVGPDAAPAGVKNWLDLSGNNCDAVQPESTNRPSIMTDTVGSGNKQVVAFNGSNQWLGLPKGFKTGLSVFVVCKPTASNGSRRILDLSDQDQYGLQTYVQNAQNLRYRVYNPTQSYLDSPTLTLNDHKLYEVLHTGTQAVVYTNGENPVVNAAMKSIMPVDRSSNFIGRDFGASASSHFAGSIAEILVYSREVTTTERHGIEAYFRARYGAPISKKPKLPPPIIEPSSTTVSGPTLVHILATNDAEVRYTDDGSMPNQGSLLYPQSGIAVTQTKTIRAIAIKANFDDSEDTTSSITVDTNSTGIVNENLIVWLNAQTVQGAHGSGVSSWADGSQKGNNADQIDIANQPLLQKPAQNGMPAIKFDGTNDFMQFTNSSFSDFTKGMTIFCVAKPTSSNSGRFIDFENDISGDSIKFYQQNGSNFEYAVSNGSTQTAVASPGITSGAFKLFEARHNGAGTATLHVNGVQTEKRTTMNNINNVTRNKSYLGKSHTGSNVNFNGQIAELLVYDKILPDSTCKIIEQYLIGKYALTQPAPPVISPGTGVLSSPTDVTLTSTTPGSILYYNIGGNPDPDTLYTGPFSIPSWAVISAKAVLPGNPSPSETIYAKIQTDVNTKHVPRDSMILWLKADQWLSGGNVVETWTDASGSGKDATQPTAAKRPTCVASAVNGLNAVDFSGSKSLQIIPTIPSDFGNGLTLYVVTKPSSASTNDRILDLGNGAPNNNILLTLDSTSTSKFWATGNSAITGPNSTSTSSYKVLEVNHTGREAAAIFSNGDIKQSLTVLANPGIAARTQNFIGQSPGNSNFLSGRIAEIILYDRSLNIDEQLKVRAYLAGRYALTDSNFNFVRPTISPPQGVYTGTQEVTMTSFPGATIYYTLNGQDPDGLSSTYTAPFSVSGTTTVKAIAKQNGIFSTVSTNLIQIDPSANNVPRLGLDLWLKGDFGLETDEFRWKDASGSGHDATQPDSNKAPFVDAPFGFPLINTQYSSDSLIKPKYLDIAPGLADLGNGLNFFTVTMPKTTSGADNYILNASNGLTDNNVEIRNLPATGRAKVRIRRGTGAAQQAQTNSNAFPLNKLQTLEVKQDGANRAQILVNGLQMADSAVDNARNVTRLTNKFGANATASGDEFYAGGTAEVLLFKRALTSTERTQMLSYLTSRYQILSEPLSMPTISPSGGEFGAPLQVAITGPIGATIKYTTDGTSPTGSGAKTYTGPFNVYFTQQVKAVATYQGILSSEATQTFVLDPEMWPAPDSSDTTPLNLQLQLPTIAVPQ